MHQLTWLEGFGYLASVIVAVSLMMSSIVKLRWYNLVGAAAFSVYGFMIQAYPVGVLNGFIALCDVYYLIRMYSAKERLRIIRATPGSDYLQCFFEEYRTEIAQLFPDFTFQVEAGSVSLYVLRDLVPACVFIGTPGPEGVLNVDLDFAVPAYRDFKPGEHLFIKNQGLFRDLGFRRLVARAHVAHHDVYLRRMGFTPTGQEKGATLFSRELA